LPAFIVEWGAGAWLAEGIRAWQSVAGVSQAAELVAVSQATDCLSVTIRELISAK